MSLYKVEVNGQDYQVSAPSSAEAIKNAIDQYLYDITQEPNNCDIDADANICACSSFLAADIVVLSPDCLEGSDAGSQTVALTWTVQDSNATDHTVSWGTASGTYTNTEKTSSTAGSYTLNVTSAGTYYIAVQTETADGLSGYSNEIVVVVA